jgi:dipeptidase D
MTNPVRTLQPTALWNHFEDINAVPRPSKKEERIIAFMKAFGEGLGLKTVVDSIGNVIIYKASNSRHGRPQNGNSAVAPGYGAPKKCGYQF